MMMIIIILTIIIIIIIIIMIINFMIIRKNWNKNDYGRNTYILEMILFYFSLELFVCGHIFVPLILRASPGQPQAPGKDQGPYISLGGSQQCGPTSSRKLGPSQQPSYEFRADSRQFRGSRGLPPSSRLLTGPVLLFVDESAPFWAFVPLSGIDCLAENNISCQFV